MAYRNGTYVAFDGQGTTDPTKSDMKYYALMKSWNTLKNHDFTFSNSHEKTYQVRDSSTLKVLQDRLMERMRNSKNMVVIISDETSWDRGMLNFEIEKAVDLYEIPLIIVYTEYSAIWGVSDDLINKLPKALKERIANGTAKCIHIPFKEKAIMAAVSQFSVHSTGDDVLTSSRNYYSRKTYEDWGYVEKDVTAKPTSPTNE